MWKKGIRDLFIFQMKHLVDNYSKINLPINLVKAEWMNRFKQTLNAYSIHDNYDMRTTYKLLFIK